MRLSSLAHAIMRDWRMVGLLFLSIILSVASGYTTWTGMQRFTGDYWLSLMVTTGIQGIMMATAWLIGESFARASSNRDPAIIGYAKGVGAIFSNLPLWVMFLSTMALSVLFSFDALFSSEIFKKGKDLMVASGRVHARKHVENIAGQLKDQVTNKRNDQYGRFLTLSAFKELEQRIGDVGDASIDAMGRLQENANLQRLKLQQQLDEQQKILSDARGVLARLEVEHKAITDQLALDRNLRPGFADRAEKLRKDHEDLSRRAREMLELRDGEDKGTGIRGASGNAGRGPKWDGYNREHRKLSDAAILVKTSLASADKDVSDIDAKLGAAEKRLKENETRQQALKIESGVADARLKAIDQALMVSVAASGSTIAKQVDDMKQALAAVKRTPEALSSADPKEPAPYTRALATCESLVRALETSGVREIEARSKQLSCAPGSVTPVVEEITRININLSSLAKACGVDLSTRLSPLDTKSLADEGRRCVEISGLVGDDSAQFQEVLSRLELDHGPDAHPFVVNRNALFLYKEPLAYLALSIAIAIDGLVFMSGLIGGRARRRRIDDIGTAEQSEDAEIVGQLSTTIYDMDGEEVKNWKTFLSNIVSDPRSLTSTRWGFLPRRYNYMGYIVLGAIADEVAKGRASTVINAAAASFGDVGIYPEHRQLSNGETETRHYVLREYYIDLAERINHANKSSRATVVEENRQGVALGHEERTTGSERRTISLRDYAQKQRLRNAGRTDR